MERYIDADKLFRYVDEQTHLSKGKLQNYIRENVTADVVEVVRCRNCKYHHWEQEPCHGKTEHFCSVLKAQVFADFYCYYGAKMDGRS